jgi:hypothetical protein
MTENHLGLAIERLVEVGGIFLQKSRASNNVCRIIFVDASGAKYGAVYPTKIALIGDKKCSRLQLV